MSAHVSGTRHGPMILPLLDMYVGQALDKYGVYCPDEFETWKPYIHQGDTVLDVGANLGAHTLAFAHQVGPTGSVIAVEPQRSLYHMLCGSVALCGMSYTVTPKHCALGADVSQLLVPPLDYDQPNNFGALELGEYEQGEPVACIPLDSWQMPRLDFLKIDVEGMELDVLEGAHKTIKRLRPIISAEADREHAIPDLLEWFKDNNYCTWWHRPLLGPLWPNVRSHNLLGLPRERQGLPEPTGDVTPAFE